MFRTPVLATASLIVMLGSAAASDRTPAPPEGKVFFITPADGATVSNPVLVQFGLSGMGVAPAGTDKPNTGHHHLIVNAGLPPLDEAIPSDDNYRHFGGGQTQTSIELPPGQHTLQLLIGDMNHVPHEPPIASDVITITVE